MQIKRGHLIVFLTFFLFIILFSFWKTSKEKPSIWEPTRTPFNPERCLKGKCEEMLNLPLPQNKGLAFSILVDREVDDEIAQWSDCLSSIGLCVEKNTEFSKEVLLDCVGKSLCPQRCKEGFEQRVMKVNSTEDLWQNFDEYFVAEGGGCVP